MTREEAIIRLKEGEPFSEIYDPVWDEALKMAISALSNYDKMLKISLDLVFENDELRNKMNELSADGDCISRQAVLDMLENINAETEGVGFYYEHYVEYIKKLPSAENKTQMIDKSNFDTDQYKTDLQSAFESGYYKGKIDGIRECTAKLEKMNEELKNE